MADLTTDAELLARAIDRLFQRLSATYGAAWDRSLGTAPIEDVRAIWARELSGFSGKLHALAYALDHLPERVPNVIEFRNLCRSAPEPQAPRLPSPAPADPERVKAAVAKLTPLTANAKPASLDWAHRIIARHAAGERVASVSLRLAREALGLKSGSAGRGSLGGIDWQAVANDGAQLDHAEQMRALQREAA